MSNKYKAIKVNGKKIDEHRHIMQVHLGRKLEYNEHVHHDDENKSNNDVSNLKVISKSDHTRLHNLGKEKSENHCNNISLTKRANPTSKLTKDQVLEIRSSLELGEKQSILASKYNVNKMTISKIKNRQIWSWLE